MAATRRLQKVSFLAINAMHKHLEYQLPSNASCQTIENLGWKPEKVQKKTYNYHFFPKQELADIKASGLKSFCSLEVDDRNILIWSGLVCPVS